MSTLVRNFPGLFRGSRQERVRCALGIGTWFCMGAFISSCAFFYLDPLISANLSGNAPAIVGGAVTAIVAAIKSA